MKLCGADCQGVCYYCIWYYLDETEGVRYDMDVYFDTAHCRLNGESMEPHYDCPNFVCSNWRPE